MPQPTQLTLLVAALTLTACGGGGDDDMVVDSGSGQDASASQDAGRDAGNDAGKDAAAMDSATTDSATNDAQTGSDAGSDASTSDAGMDAGKALAFAMGGHVSALDGSVSDAQGAALLVRTDAGHTLVSLQVSGLGVSKMYPAHVHNLPCSMAAGGHYQHVVDGGVTDTNEVWPLLMTDDAGQARSFVDVDKVLREDAVSVVVHNPDANNAKMLCADLVTQSPSSFTTNGTPKAFPAAADAGVSGLTGTASLTRASDGTTKAGISVQNLRPNTQYMVHIHDQPCAFASGGGHYKFDYSVAGAVANNEIWLNFTSNDAGVGSSDASVNHVSRAEAQAIVIHAMDAMSTRLACIDLKP